MSTSAITTPVTQPLSYWLNFVFMPIYEDKKMGYLSALGILRRMKRANARVLYHQNKFIRALEEEKNAFEATRTALAEQHDVADMLHKRMHGDNEGWLALYGTSKDAWDAYDKDIQETMAVEVTLEAPLITAAEIDRNEEYWNAAVYEMFEAMLDLDSFDADPDPGSM